MCHYTITVHRNLSASKKSAFVLDAELNFNIIFYFRIRIFNLTIAQKDNMLTRVLFNNNKLLFNSDFYYKYFI